MLFTNIVRQYRAYETSHFWKSHSASGGMVSKASECGAMLPSAEACPGRFCCCSPSPFRLIRFLRGYIPKRWAGRKCVLRFGAASGEQPELGYCRSSWAKNWRACGIMSLPVRRIGQRRRATRAPRWWLYSGKGSDSIRAFSFPAGSPKAINALLGPRVWLQDRYPPTQEPDEPPFP